MTKSLYYLFFAVILFTSCKDEEDNAPQSFLNGTYEIAGENTDTGIWYVRQYAFKADGTYEYFILLRESQSGGDLGYSYYIKGTYTLRGQDLVTKVSESFAVNYQEYPEGYAASLSDLEAQDILPQYAESKGVLKRMDDGERISLIFECNDILASCVGEQVYDRVD